MKTMAWAAAMVGLLAVPSIAWGELPEKLPSGTWKINGDGFEGELILEVADGGRVTGTVYGNPISGMYQVSTKRLSFVRMYDPKDPATFQAYQGYLFRNNDAGKLRYTLAGSFFPTDLAFGSADAVPEMGWYAQITPSDAPPVASEKPTARKSITIPRQFDLRPQFVKFDLPPRSQGARNTCSVFVTTAALELALSRHRSEGTSLSVEYLNWACNQVIKNKSEDRGQFFHNLLKGFELHGICLEADMPYETAFNGNLAPSPKAIDEAKEIAATPFKIHWINPWKKEPGLSDPQLREIKEVLASGWPVAAGSSHSLLLVGYVNDLKQPGGGVFITKDSGKGAYDTVTYEFAKAKIGDVYWIEAPTKPKAK